MSKSFDPRVTPVRADLAAASLRGRIAAPRYVEGRPMTVTASRTALKSTPDPEGALATELLFGEGFMVYEERDGWAWGQSTGDGYVGYVAAAALGPAAPAPSHWVSALASHVYAEPDFKRPPVSALFFTSPVTVAGEAERKFLPLASGGFVHHSHLTPLGAWQPDHVAVALRFLGAPYVWGGRTVAGLDCSALIQLALSATGRPCLRDSDQQAATVGRDLQADEKLRRGDIVYFPGHVGIMIDADHILHANATHMAVTVDPLAEVIDIVARTSDHPVAARRRLPPQ